jgi:hypothetical protein
VGTKPALYAYSKAFDILAPRKHDYTSPSDQRLLYKNTR